MHESAIRSVEIDGKPLLLTILGGEGFSCIVDYIRKTRKPPSAVERVLAQLKDSEITLSEQIKSDLLRDAMKMDHEEAMRERFAPPNIPKTAFFDADVIALIFSLIALPKQPHYTVEYCREIVDRLGPLFIMTKISECFPSDPEKKGQVSSGELWSGTTTTGQPNVQN